MFEFLGCQIEVPPQHMSAIVRTESAGKQFAIGIVGYYLSNQPQDEAMAQALTADFKKNGINFSVGLAQVNQSNFEKYNLKEKDLFNPCENLRAGSEILRDCYKTYNSWDKAYSCYYSGNAITGFRHGYVSEVRKNFTKPVLTQITPPDLALLGEPIFLHKINKKQGNPKNKLGLANDSSYNLASRRLGGAKKNTIRRGESQIASSQSLKQRRLSAPLSSTPYSGDKFAMR